MMMMMRETRFLMRTKHDTPQKLGPPIATTIHDVITHVTTSRAFSVCPLSWADHKTTTTSSLSLYSDIVIRVSMRRGTMCSLEHINVHHNDVSGKRGWWWWWENTLQTRVHENNGRTARKTKEQTRWITAANNIFTRGVYGGTSTNANRYFLVNLLHQERSYNQLLTPANKQLLHGIHASLQYQKQLITCC